jgi:alanine dehydrogenase
MTLVLTGDDYAELVSMDDCIGAVEEAFRAYAEGRIDAGLLSAHLARGAVHIKTASDGRYFAAKLNANFPGNHPLPTIQGVMVLFDASNGVPLALIDSIALTKQRTAAATAVAAKHLACRDAQTATIVGCGEQGEAQLEAIARVLPLQSVHAFDIDGARAADFARRMCARLRLHVRAEKEIVPADVIVTCTTSKKAFLTREHLRPGAFVAAVGADNPEKSEIAPEAMRASVVIADVLQQCASIGDLRAAIAANAMTKEDVRAELGEIVAGRKTGRRADDEIIIFDSTGAGFQDVAAAAIAFERAEERGQGMRVSFRGRS